MLKEEVPSGLSGLVGTFHEQRDEPLFGITLLAEESLDLASDLPRLLLAHAAECTPRSATVQQVDRQRRDRDQKREHGRGEEYPADLGDLLVRLLEKHEEAAEEDGEEDVRHADDDRLNGEMKSPRIRLLGYVTGLPVYLVDGLLVRNKIDLDFTCGGNGAVYPNYVPRNEIWIDDALNAFDRTATVLHEIVERNLMFDRGWSYDRAHDAASASERVFREELALRPPRATDLHRVEAALLAGAPRPRSRHHRETPKVLANGKRARIKREVNEALRRDPPRRARAPR